MSFFILVAEIRRSSSARRDTSFFILAPRYGVLQPIAKMRSSSIQLSISFDATSRIYIWYYLTIYDDIYSYVYIRNHPKYYGDIVSFRSEFAYVNMTKEIMTLRVLTLALSSKSSVRLYLVWGPFPKYCDVSPMYCKRIRFRPQSMGLMYL